MSVVLADVRILQGAEGMEIHSLSGQSGSPGFIPFLEMLVVLKMDKTEIYGPLCFVPCLSVCLSVVIFLLKLPSLASTLCMKIKEKKTSFLVWTELGRRVSFFIRYCV